jgi:cobyrinic acid a,c-diamide synthase
MLRQALEKARIECARGIASQLKLVLPQRHLGWCRQARIRACRN